MKNAIVVGAGIGGIATAIRLAAKGYKVTVYEAAQTPGGKMAVLEDAGYRWDKGPSLFTLPHLVDELFTLAGEDATEHFSYIRKEEACRYYWDDGTRLTAWADENKFALEVEEKLGVPAPRLKAHLAHSRFLWERTRPFFLEKSLHRPQTYFSAKLLPTLFALSKLHLFKSLHRLNSKKLNHPKLVQLFDRYATYNGSDPYQAPGVMNVIPHLEHHLGTYLPKGGMYDIPKSLAALAERQGIEFRYDHPVEEIVVQNGKAVGVKSLGDFYPADVVVSNMDIVPTYRKLLPKQPAPEKTLGQERSSSALIFYWGINRSFDELGLHNIFFAKDYKREFEAIFKDKTVADDFTVYVNITSKDLPAEAPPNAENWFVMVNTPADYGQDWAALIPKIRKGIIKKLNPILNTDLAQHIEVEHMLTPAMIELNTSSYRGALYGAASNNRTAAFLRHPNFSRKIKNLFFCGGSVHPGGGIPLCLYSAKIIDEIVEKP